MNVTFSFSQILLWYCVLDKVSVVMNWRQVAASIVCVVCVYWGMCVTTLTCWKSIEIRDESYIHSPPHSHTLGTTISLYHLPPPSLPHHTLPPTTLSTTYSLLGCTCRQTSHWLGSPSSEGNIVTPGPTQWRSTTSMRPYWPHWAQRRTSPPSSLWWESLPLQRWALYAWLGCGMGVVGVWHGCGIILYIIASWSSLTNVCV